jgi:Tol biopolymer transport system component
VRDLGHLLRGSDKSLGRLARGILKAMAKEDDSLRVRNAALAILKDYEERKTPKDRSRPSTPSPLERTQPTKPIAVQPTAKKGNPNRDPDQTPKLPKEILAALIQGILALMGVALTAYVTYLIAFHPSESNLTPEASTMTSMAVSITSATTAIPSSSEIISQPTNLPLLTNTSLPSSNTLVPPATDTPILPTSTSPPLPTSTLVPTIVVPSYTLTYTLTPIPPLSTFTPVGGGAGKIAFNSDQNGNHEIYVMNADGSGQINITNNSAIDEQASWFPGARRIAFTSTRDGNYQIYVMNVDGSNPIRLTNNGLSNGGPSLSRDGGKIVFYAGLNSSESEEIYVMNADGSGQIRLTQNSLADSDPSWSPDGTKIAFCSNRDSQPEIYVMNADGSGQMNITNNGSYDYYPRWSPDGRKIAFVSYRDGNLEIYVMNGDGSGLMRLTQNNAVDHFPSWSPDGRKIVFTSNRDDPNPGTCGDKCIYKIYVMNADGSNQFNIANYSEANPYLSWSP